jgi:hypothetical protein
VRPGHEGSLERHELPLLHIVENYRDGDRVRQRIVGSLGRLDGLSASGDLEQVIRQLVDHGPAVKFLCAEAAGTLQVERDRSWGPVLIFERLWEGLGLRDLIRGMATRRNFDFDMPPAALGWCIGPPWSLPKP